jgi:glycosidase
MNRNEVKKMEKHWWQKSIVYQIYPRSFNDTNGDGIGDINGVTEKLDYIKELGADVIWLCPIYSSPNDDNGYDISDYYNIMPEAGTMADLECLIKEADKRGIKILMDLVVNHTSDEHYWFVEAKKSKDNPYRDYYIWSDPSEDGGVPNDLHSTFSGSAWEFDEASQQYYLHLFSKKQPDLNWENEKMRNEIYDMMNFWIDKGIAGFRMDVIELLGKKPFEGITENGPKLHDYLQEMNKKTFGKKDLLTVGECWGANPDIAKKYCGNGRNELSMVFQFEHINKRGDKWHPCDVKLTDLKQIFNKWQTAMYNNGWNTLFWNNHDTPRVVSTFGNDSNEYRVLSAKMLAVMMYSLQGTPYIYQGEEIGMTNVRFKSIDDYRDVESINMYNERISQGCTQEEIMKSIYLSGRDNARTPMQWDDSKNAGFSDAKPWIEVNENYTQINVKNSIDDKNSIFNFYKKLIALRKQYDVFPYGTFKLLLPDNEKICAYERKYNGEHIRVVCNYSADSADLNMDISGTLMLSNYDSLPLENKLRPYEAFIIKLS